MRASAGVQLLENPCCLKAKKGQGRESVLDMGFAGRWPSGVGSWAGSRAAQPDHNRSRRGVDDGTGGHRTVSREKPG